LILVSFLVKNRTEPVLLTPRIYYLNQIYVEFVLHGACVYLKKKNKEKKGIGGECLRL
jgi:hypothetical protein